MALVAANKTSNLGMFNNREWLWCRVYGTLSDRQLDQLREGQELPVNGLGTTMSRMLTDLLDSGVISINSSDPTPFTVGVGVEPTARARPGLPSDARLKVFTNEERTFAVRTHQRGGDWVQFVTLQMVTYLQVMKESGEAESQFEIQPVNRTVDILSLIIPDMAAPVSRAFRTVPKLDEEKWGGLEVLTAEELQTVQDQVKRQLEYLRRQQQQTRPPQ
jgi:hypothetical protein